MQGFFNFKQKKFNNKCYQQHILTTTNGVYQCHCTLRKQCYVVMCFINAIVSLQANTKPDKGILNDLAKLSF